MDLTSAARRLYGVAPEEFTATRQELAKLARRDGDTVLAKRLGALRRPTVSAWAVNLLSREAAPELEMLLDTGSDLRGAWSQGRPISGLEQRRGELVDLLVRTARRLAAEAGRPLRDPAVREVEDTLLAATVDPDAAEEVRAGALSHPLSHTGFVPAGFAPAPPTSEEQAPQPARKRPAAPKTTPHRNPSAARRKPQIEPQAADGPAERAERERRRAETAKKAEEAERRAVKAESVLEAREAEADEARRELNAVEAEAQRLRAELDAAEHRGERLRRRLERAERRRARAAEDAAKARTAARP
ncbi:hypothetical protein AB0J52_23535, partial [Spirillospora sp. NPDC049652]